MVRAAWTKFRDACSFTFELAERMKVSFSKAEQSDGLLECEEVLWSENDHLKALHLKAVFV